MANSSFSLGFYIFPRVFNAPVVRPIVDVDAVAFFSATVVFLPAPYFALEAGRV